MALTPQKNTSGERQSGTDEDVVRGAFEGWRWLAIGCSGLGFTHRPSRYADDVNCSHIAVIRQENKLSKEGKPLEFQGKSMERTTGVEPASKAWEAFILPMNYVRMCASTHERQVYHLCGTLRHVPV